MKKYLFLFLVFLKSSSFSQNYKSFKINAAAYSFKLGDSQGALSKFIEYDELNQEFIRSVQAPYNAIEIFNTKTGLLKKTIKTKTNKIGSFKKNSNSSFWIHDPITRVYQRINYKGDILNKLKEPDYSEDLIFIASSDYPYAPIITYDDFLFVTGRIMFKDLNPKNLDSYKNTGIIEKLNIKGKASFMGHPTKLSSVNFYGNMNNYSITINKNLLIAAPHFSDEIQVFNLENNNHSIINLKTNYGKLIKPLSKITDAYKFKNVERNEYFKNSYTNVGFVYDKYNNVYYRFVRHPYTNPGPMNCSILVFDKNFKLLFENKIDQKKYNVSQFFVTEKGLAIFNYQKYNSDNSKLIFDLFSLI
jgi:hypothetical protein